MQCEACGGKVRSETDYMEHVLMEEHAACPCGLWEYHYVTGASEERVGHLTFSWGYEEGSEAYRARRAEMGPAVAEARRLAAHPNRRAFALSPGDYHGDPVRCLVVADWLAEQGFPANEAAVRAAVEAAAPAPEG